MVAYSRGALQVLLVIAKWLGREGALLLVRDPAIFIATFIAAFAASSQGVAIVEEPDLLLRQCVDLLRLPFLALQ